MQRTLARMALSLSVAALAGLLMTGAAALANSSTTAQMYAQARAHIVIHPRRIEPGPYAKRYCRSWLAKEIRVSGPVIVPRMQCWWQ